VVPILNIKEKQDEDIFAEVDKRQSMLGNWHTAVPQFLKKEKPVIPS
jgi:hypothetical protein